MTDTLKYSVTQDNYRDDIGGVSILVGPVGLGGTLHHIAGSTGLPPGPSKARDAILAASRDVENMWASAIYRAVTKQAALGFRVEDQADSERRINAAQDLLLTADGSGWVSFIQKVFTDYLTTDNGAFIEIARSSTARGSRIMGLYHLDSLRCERTNDPDRPVVYYSNRRYHELRDWQVVSMADMPSPRVDAYGAGECAASRAWATILKLAAVETYFREKVSGQRNLAIHIVNSMSAKQLKDALATSDEDAKNANYVIYRGSTIIPLMGDAVPTVATIPLAEIPDGFDPDLERRDAYLRYANALGIPVQDIQPLSGQGLGTGTQTLILDEAAEAQGLAAGRKKLQHIISHYILPAATTFYLATNDLRDQRQQAEVRKLRADERAARIASGELTPQEARQLALDAGDLPPELFAADDATPGGTITDEQKPLDEVPDAPEPLLELRATGKAVDLDVDDLIDGALGEVDAILAEARRLDDAA